MKTIDETVYDFIEGKIDKVTFIKDMYKVHHAKLFDYSHFLHKTNIKKIEVSDNSVLMTTRDRGIKILCPPKDHRIAPIEILNFFDYEKNDSDMMMKLLDGIENFFDIGANIGWYSINIAVAFRNINVFSFEPIPTTYQHLCNNVSINSVRNIKTYNFGFSENSALIPFYFYPEGSGNASIRDLTNFKNVKSIDCRVLKLDDFITEKKLKVDFIKCDVEGGELLVFKGGIETINRFKPIIFSEILRKWSAKFEYNPNNIFELLFSKDYRAFTTTQSGLIEFFEMNESTTETNFFFLHSKKHKHLIARYSN